MKYETHFITRSSEALCITAFTGTLSGHVKAARAIGCGAWTVLPKLSKPQSRLPRRISGAGLYARAFDHRDGNKSQIHQMRSR
jgi:hypothetical protein